MGTRKHFAMVGALVGAALPLGMLGLGRPASAQDPGGNAPTQCYTFTDAGLMCLDCSDITCGACIDYQGNVCEREEAKVCRHSYETTPASEGHYRTLVTRTCYFFTSCVAVFPCEGRPCENGQWLRDGGGSVNIFIPGDPCPWPQGPGPG